MKVQLLKDIDVSLPWEGRSKIIKAYTWVETYPAGNLPNCERDGLLWVLHPAVSDYGYYISHSDGDYTL